MSGPARTTDLILPSANLADRPLPEAVPAGSLFPAIDTQIIYRNNDDGTGWDAWLVVADFNVETNAEEVRDIVAAQLVAGTGTTLTVDDAGNTITVAVSTDAEVVRDTIAAALVAGTGMTITSDDGADTITLAVSASVDAEVVRDLVGTTLVAGTNVTIAVDDAANTVTIDAEGGVGATALDDLTDVVTAGATSGQILAFDGTQWEPQTVAASGGSAPTFVFHGNNTTQARPAVDHVVWVGLLKPENGYAPADTWVKADIGTLPMPDTSPYMATVMSDSPAAYWRLGGLDRPVFTASASSSYLGEGPDNALKDNSEGSRWTTDGGATGWLRAEYLDAVAADKYVLQRRDDIPARNPTAWTFEGSNDGATWTVLDTRTGITWPTASAHRLFTFTNTTEYLYYRINVTANGGDGYLSIAGMWIGEYHGSMVADYSGNSHAGAWDVAPATYGAAGLITATSDKAAYCDGVTDSRVTVPYGAWMNMETGMAAEIIIKPIVAAGRKRSMMQRHGLFNLRLNAENQPEVNYNSGALVLTSATALTMGQTYHVVYSYDATANSMTLYVNGAQVAAVGGVTLPSGTTEILRIGSISGTADERWAGTLDEAALYTAPLSAARVLAHYNAAVAV